MSFYIFIYNQNTTLPQSLVQVYFFSKFIFNEVTYINGFNLIQNWKKWPETNLQTKLLSVEQKKKSFVQKDQGLSCEPATVVLFPLVSWMPLILLKEVIIITEIYVCSQNYFRN